MPTDRTENWVIKSGKRGHNWELTVGLVLCEHKIVNDSGPDWNFWFHSIWSGDIFYNCVWGEEGARVGWVGEGGSEFFNIKNLPGKRKQ